MSEEKQKRIPFNLVNFLQGFALWLGIFILGGTVLVLLFVTIRLVIVAGDGAVIWLSQTFALDERTASGIFAFFIAGGILATLFTWREKSDE